MKRTVTADVIVALLGEEVAAAIGHMVSYQVEDDAQDKVLMHPALAKAASDFYPTARRLADLIDNVEPPSGAMFPEENETGGFDLNAHCTTCTKVWSDHCEIHVPACCDNCPGKAKLKW